MGRQGCRLGACSSSRHHRGRGSLNLSDAHCDLSRRSHSGLSIVIGHRLRGRRSWGWRRVIACEDIECALEEVARLVAQQLKRVLSLDEVSTPRIDHVAPMCSRLS